LPVAPSKMIIANLLGAAAPSYNGAVPVAASRADRIPLR